MHSNPHTISNDEERRSEIACGEECENNYTIMNYSVEVTKVFAVWHMVSQRL